MLSIAKELKKSFLVILKKLKVNQQMAVWKSSWQLSSAKVNNVRKHYFLFVSDLTLNIEEASFHSSVLLFVSSEWTLTCVLFGIWHVSLAAYTIDIDDMVL